MTYADTRPDLIVNCTGLGALTLGDVEDKAVFPTRGQLCIIRAPWIKHGKTVKGEGWSSYTIPRSSGVVIIGGTKEGRDWEAAVRPETTQLMLERAVRYDRDLLPPEKREYGTWEDLDLLEVGVGRRPSRNGGVRREFCEGESGPDNAVSWRPCSLTHLHALVMGATRPGRRANPASLRSQRKWIPELLGSS